MQQHAQMWSSSPWLLWGRHIFLVHDVHPHIKAGSWESSDTPELHLSTPAKYLFQTEGGWSNNWDTEGFSFSLPTLPPCLGNTVCILNLKVVPEFDILLPRRRISMTIFALFQVSWELGKFDGHYRPSNFLWIQFYLWLWRRTLKEFSASLCSLAAHAQA